MAITLSRRSLICNQAVPHVTGIDFVQVADPALQTELLVFFIVDPGLVVVQDGPPQVFMVNLVGPLPQPAANPPATRSVGIESVIMAKTADRWRESQYRLMGRP